MQFDPIPTAESVNSEAQKLRLEVEKLKSRPEVPGYILEPNSIFQAAHAGAVVIASGTIIPVDHSPIQVTLPSNAPPEGLTFRIVVEKDPAAPQAQIVLGVDSNNAMIPELRFKNFEAPLGGGTADPIQLWTSREFAILTHVRLYTQGSAPATVHFTIYRKPLEGAK